MSNLQRKKFRGAIATFLAASAALNLKNYLLVNHLWWQLAAGIICALGAILNLLYVFYDNDDEGV